MILIKHLIICSTLILSVCSQAQEAGSKEKRILILGDSLTAGYGVAKENAYPALVEKELNSTGHKVKVINAGSSGSTSASGLGRLKWHLKVKPDVLVLALGGNDGLRGVDLSSTKKNLEKVVELAKEKDIKVVLAGMKLPLNYSDKYRKQFEDMYVDLVKKHKTGHIPFLLKNVGANPDLNLPDGIHPNEKGHKVVAETVANYLKGYL